MSRLDELGARMVAAPVAAPTSVGSLASRARQRRRRRAAIGTACCLAVVVGVAGWLARPTDDAAPDVEIREQPVDPPPSSTSAEMTDDGPVVAGLGLVVWPPTSRGFADPQELIDAFMVEALDWNPADVVQAGIDRSATGPTWGFLANNELAREQRLLAIPTPEGWGLAQLGDAPTLTTASGRVSVHYVGPPPADSTVVTVYLANGEMTELAGSATAAELPVDIELANVASVYVVFLDDGIALGAAGTQFLGNGATSALELARTTLAELEPGDEVSPLTWAAAQRQVEAARGPFAMELRIDDSPQVLLSASVAADGSSEVVRLDGRTVKADGIVVRIDDRSREVFLREQDPARPSGVSTGFSTADDALEISSRVETLAGGNDFEMVFTAAVSFEGRSAREYRLVFSDPVSKWAGEGWTLVVDDETGIALTTRVVLRDGGTSESFVQVGPGPESLSALPVIVPAGYLVFYDNWADMGAGLLQLPAADRDRTVARVLTEARDAAAGNS